MIEKLKLTRIKGWKDNLSKLINDSRRDPFDWGTHDCGQWAMAAVDAITDFNMAEPSLGTYETAIGAFKCLSKIYEADNVKQLFSDRFEEIHVALARPGDIVYKNSNHEGFNVALGVCYGFNSFFIMIDELGLIELPTLSLDGAFRIA